MHLSNSNFIQDVRSPRRKACSYRLTRSKFDDKRCEYIHIEMSNWLSLQCVFPFHYSNEFRTKPINIQLKSTAYCHCRQSYIQSCEHNCCCHFISNVVCSSVCVYCFGRWSFYLHFIISMRSAGLAHKMMFSREFRCCKRMCVRRNVCGRQASDQAHNQKNE